MRRIQAILTQASPGRADLAVLAQSSRLSQPGEGFLHNSALGQHFEGALLAALDRLHLPAKHVPSACPISVPV